MNIKFSELLTWGIGFLILAVTVALLIFAIISLIRLFVKIKKLEHPEIIKYYFFMIACVLIMAASWLLNMGWLRVILTWLAVPAIHAVLFMVLNGKAMLKLFLSKRLKVYTLLSFATYILTYACFPDSGDIGPMYVFFGLLQNNIIAAIALQLCVISFIAHVVISILQIIELSKLKKDETTQEQPNAAL